MARVRKYIETDVLTEAKKRIHHIFDLFDRVVVMFSGGKDSLVVLHLVREVMVERGLLNTPVDVVFRDEELIPDEVINFVAGYMKKEWIRMLWFTVPLASTKYVMGVVHPYIQWDQAREFKTPPKPRPKGAKPLSDAEKMANSNWVRPKPSWGLNLEPGDTRVMDQWTMDAYVAAHYGAGKMAFLTGIRAAESLIRFRASVNKLNENYINAVTDPTCRHVNLCKPIFDWEENDVFRYFYDRKITYCPLYDMQMWAGSQLRVATPMIAESAKKFDKVASTTPDFYQRVISVFPDMLVQERYFKDIDRAALTRRYGQTLDGVQLWIDEHITEEAQYQKATKRLAGVVGREIVSPGSYPADYVLSCFMGGHYKREILPKPREKA